MSHDCYYFLLRNLFSSGWLTSDSVMELLALSFMPFSLNTKITNSRRAAKLFFFFCSALTIHCKKYMSVDVYPHKSLLAYLHITLSLSDTIEKNYANWWQFNKTSSYVKCLERALTSRFFSTLIPCSDFRAALKSSAQDAVDWFFTTTTFKFSPKFKRKIKMTKSCRHNRRIVNSRCNHTGTTSECFFRLWLRLTFGFIFC